jgi:hypothetical protein
MHARVNPRRAINARHDVDGFHLVSGLVAVIAGPVMFAAGGPAGFAALLTVVGVAVLVGAWMTAT